MPISFRNFQTCPTLCRQSELGMQRGFQKPLGVSLPFHKTCLHCVIMLSINLTTSKM
jgi:hypothetical protein